MFVSFMLIPGLCCSVCCWCCVCCTVCMIVLTVLVLPKKFIKAVLVMVALCWELICWNVVGYCIGCVCCMFIGWTVLMSMSGMFISNGSEIVEKVSRDWLCSWRRSDGMVSCWVKSIIGLSGLVMVFVVTFGLSCLSLPNLTFFFCLPKFLWFFLFLLDLFLGGWRGCGSSKLSNGDSSNSGDESSSTSVAEVLCVRMCSVCTEMDVSAGKVCVCSFLDMICFVCVVFVLSKLLSIWVLTEDVMECVVCLVYKWLPSQSEAQK